MDLNKTLKLSRELAFDIMGVKYNSVRIRRYGNLREWYCPYCGKWVTGFETRGEDETLQMNCSRCQRLLVFRMIDMEVENGELE